MEKLFIKVLPNETVTLTEKEDRSFNKLEHEKILSQKYNASVNIVKTVIYTPIAYSNTEIITEP